MDSALDSEPDSKRLPRVDVLTTSWGRGWYTRALNIPAELRDRVCYHCGRIIKWGTEADLKGVPVPFSAHGKCQKHQFLIHASPDEYQRVLGGKETVSGNGSIQPVDDEAFSANMERSKNFLESRWYKRVWILFLNLINGGEL